MAQQDQGSPTSTQETKTDQGVAMQDIKSSKNLAAFTEVVESRRSVRRFTDTPIPDDVLRDCLRLAMLCSQFKQLTAVGVLYY